MLVDSDTKWTEAVPLKTAIAGTTIDAPRRTFACFGLPETLVSDDMDHSFQMQHWLDLKKKQHMCHMTITAPYRPQSNGLVERVVRTIKEGLKKNKGDMFLICSNQERQVYSRNVAGISTNDETKRLLSR